MISLEREASLRLQQATQVEIVCVAGVVWITQEGDPRDIFVAAGQSLLVQPRGLTLLTALEPATVQVVDRGVAGKAARWWRQMTSRAVGATATRPREAAVRP
jgi:Protein of unknown function (DUF2917)